MSKYLESVLKEMRNYSEMGMPDGEGSMGMGSVANMGVRGKRGSRVEKAYKLNDIMRSRNNAEEEEMDDMEGNDMGDDRGYDDMESGDMESGDMESGGDVEEIKQFFTDNPAPSDDEILAYSEEHDMDMDEMRQAVYDLIQSLLPDDEGMDDEGMDDEGMDDESHGDMDMDSAGSDDLDFSVRGDTGERPARNEFEEHMYGRRSTDRSRNRRKS